MKKWLAILILTVYVTAYAQSLEYESGSNSLPLKMQPISIDLKNGYHLQNSQARMSDTIQHSSYELFGTVNNQNNLMQGFTRQDRLFNMPYNLDYRTEGVIASSNKFLFYGVHELEEHPNMLTVQRFDIAASYTNGAVTANVGAKVNKYYALGLTTQYGIHGALTYRFSPSVSATIFGEYYNRNPWIYMAAFPFVNTSRYGGFVTLNGKTVGTHLGAERYYDSFMHKWEMRPIVTPYIHVSKRVTIELPLGGLLKGTTDRLFFGRRNNSPIIRPTVP